MALAAAVITDMAAMVIWGDGGAQGIVIIVAIGITALAAAAVDRLARLTTPSGQGQ